MNLLQALGEQSDSPCDYAFTACTEPAFSDLYSVYRQYTADVVILQKLLALRDVEWTDDGAAADLYIVPYLAKSDCMDQAPQPTPF